MKIKGYILLLLFIVVFASCKRFPNLFADKQLLAEVNGQSLYLYDIESIFTPGMSSEDSVKLLDSYVDQWVKKQLKVVEAEQIFKGSEDDIEKMVEEYRTSLLTYKVDQFYIDNHIDTVFTDEQIDDYYNQHKGDFVLDKAIVKARVVKVPDNYRQFAKLKELMNSSRSEDYQNVLDICTKNGFEMTEFNSWSDFSELQLMLPVDKDKKYDNMLTENKVFEFPVKDYIYLAKITDRRLSGDYQPKENVSDIIKRVIFNERKQELIRNYEDSLYKNAVADKKLKIKK